MTFKRLANPILIVGDNPSLSGGLSRICRDLATLCCTMPEFRVAVLGRGIGNRRMFPFKLYDYPEGQPHEGVQWGQDYIQHVWEDFSGGENGVIFSTDDPSRRHWFSNPTGLGQPLERFLGEGRNFQKWGYFPIDSTGPNGISLPTAAVDCLSKYDRVLVASQWGANVVRSSGVNTDWLPHGIWMDKFKEFALLDAALQATPLLPQWAYKSVVGCVMANQSRKDYPVAFECFARLKERYGYKFLAWLHTDQMVRYWNVYALAADYGVTDCLEVTTNLNDDQLALRYSSSDCTILPSGGEGFGYPIAESLSCGTGCIVTGYGAGCELVTPHCWVDPVAYRVDTAYNSRRAVNRGRSFAELAIQQIDAKRSDWDFKSSEYRKTVEHLDWKVLQEPWMRWLREGLK